jgi:hypothetical protein
MQKPDLALSFVILSSRLFPIGIIARVCLQCARSASPVRFRKLKVQVLSSASHATCAPAMPL